MRGLLLTLSLCGALIAAGCGGSSGGDPDTDPASLAPARAPVYAEVSLESDEDFDAVAEKLSGKADASAEITRLLEKSINEEGSNVDFKKDIEPWIGDRLGIFFLDLSDDAQGAFVAPAEDADKAETSLAKLLKETDEDDKKPQISGKKYKDVEYQVDSANDSAYAVLDGTAVFGTEQGVKGAIDAQDGESLSETDSLKTARDQVEDDGLIFAFVALRQLIETAGGNDPDIAQLQTLLGSAGDRLAISGDVDDGSIELEFVTLGVKDPVNAEPGALLAQMPADAWLAGGLASFGKTIETSLKQLEATPDGRELSTALAQIERSTGIDVRADVLSWIGDIGFFVRGSSINDLGGALVVAASDPAKPKKLLADLQSLAKAAGDASLRELKRDGYEGVTIRTDEVPMPIHVAVGDKNLIVAVGDDALGEAISPSSKLTDSEPFKKAADALGGDVKPAFFANLDPVKSLIEASGALSQAGADAAEVKRVLDNLTTVAAGASTEGDVQKTKIAVQVK